MSQREKYESDGATSDEGRGKRGRADEAFARTKKTHRSPITSNRNKDKLDLLVNMIKELKIQQEQIQQGQTEIKEEMIRDENNRIKGENLELKAENKEIKEKLVELDRKLEWIERERMRNNLIYSVRIANKYR